LIGSTVSHYQIVERLGGGGMGVVYKARDLRLDRTVALKFLAAQRGAPEEQKRRFIREAKAASSLDHPNICTIFEIGETEDGALFIAMAFYEGETLRDRLVRGPLAVAEAVEIAAQIAAGLARAHERGIVHRDVKPANVILTADGQVKLLDFGIAKLSDQSRLTRAGTAMGTTAYISPEQFFGELAGPPADIWSLGVLLYQSVTGRLPFEAASEKEMARAIVEQEPRPLAVLRTGVPPALQRIVSRALAKRPADRYARMEALRDDLRSLAAEMAVPESVDEDRTLLEVPAAAASRSGTREAALLAPTAGPFEILEPLGGGGMGVVCKARDTRLNRVVALKFLPWELTRDPEAKRRFMQEAHAASALDHPNICTILEVGETSDGRLYLAMPCYDGETLRRRLERGPLPVEEAVDIAEQIARGLAKAHRNDIVHRDIKPANLVVTEDGVVKILDFGLAKLAGEVAISRTGSSAGTPAYMSPEQARGEPVDFHTDLWSLGVVLYEMLAGRRPFRAEHEQAVIYAILNQRLQPLREVRPDVPPEVERIVGRLLARDPAERYASAEAVFADLRALRGGTLTGTMLLTRPRTGVRPWMWGAAAGVAALVIAGVFLLPRFGGREEPVPLQPKFSRLTDQEGREWYPVLSPAGDYFVYARETAPGNLDIYLQRIGGSNPINLTADSPVDDTQPAYSPDGKRIAFRSERDGGGIFLMEATGEAVRRLTDFGFAPAWSPDGTQILVDTEGVEDPRGRSPDSRIWRVEVATGRRARLAIKGDAVQPSWSPSGRRIAYWSVSSAARRVLWTSLPDGGDPVVLIDDAYLNWNPVWSPDGRYLFFASDRSGSMNLWRVPIDEATGRSRGEPEPIATPSQWSGLLSISRDGRRILYTTREGSSNIARAAFDPVTASVLSPLAPITQGSREVHNGKVSPDGRWVVFNTLNPQEDLFLVRPDGSGLRQLTSDAFKDRGANWSPDGRIVFFSNRSGRYGAWSIRPDGSELRPLTGLRETVTQPLLSPDGRWLVLTFGFSAAALIDLTKPAAARAPQILPQQALGVRFYPYSWSPDSKRLAGGLAGGGVAVFALASQRYERLTERGRQPVWMGDSRRLLYLDSVGAKVYLVDSATRESREILASPGASTITSVDLSPDDRMLYIVRGTREGDVWMATLHADPS
jgi:serine/threonine protein kinase/Tol biopolymer transport system component